MNFFYTLDFESYFQSLEILCCTIYMEIISFCFKGLLSAPCHHGRKKLLKILPSYVLVMVGWFLFLHLFENYLNVSSSETIFTTIDFLIKKIFTFWQGKRKLLYHQKMQNLLTVAERRCNFRLLKQNTPQLWCTTKSHERFVL